MAMGPVTERDAQNSDLLRESFVLLCSSAPQCRRLYSPASSLSDRSLPLPPLPPPSRSRKCQQPLRDTTDSRISSSSGMHQALPNKTDVGPLKALLAYEALVHPDHPLHKQGIDGVELFLGTFANGEMRLLFSSAQVEYLRYWLHAMQLTRAPIPIPSSDSLLQAKDLTNCSPVVYKDAATLKKAVKTIDKNNKRLKGTGTLLTTRRISFEKIRTFWAAHVGTWLAIDFEAWDRDHTVLTEFGWSLARWEDEGRKKIDEDGHMVVKEHIGYMNTYVEQNRDHYSFGKSEIVDKMTFRQRIRDMIADHRAAGPLFLVFHDNSQDIKYLRSEYLQALSDFEYLLPDQPPTTGVYVVDTGNMFSALEGESGGNMRSLERVCRHLQVPVSYLHNAGNDAHYTMAAMVAMASGDPVDEQREKRWPNRTTHANPKVEFKPWEEDSDLSDLEGVMPVDTAMGTEGDGPGDGTTWNGFDL
ncbi:uncharacterized protein FIBRA_05311 [Fibroporia radiculosa]|uniref:Gfd2/YDR514C-like C-terminal domain-containing protein n=1 Tax=Fibroporia radiculosa TaxID=599839 RepID=J4H3F6_9APHY|nr:uncharacterized protein FIBRA_05311 [Fibroporia radiculosa]CCM03189.1 predicted protein [Fibroporia radiculosa]